MFFTTIQFIIFIIITVSIYYATPKANRWIVLLIASGFFYLTSGAKYLIFIAFSTIITFYAGICLDRVNKNKHVIFFNNTNLTVKGKKKCIVFIVLFLNFGILIFLKYFNFIGSNINFILDILVAKQPVPKLNLLLPLGISFYTFQSAGYIIDVFRGKFEPNRNLAKFALFVSFFPQIVQGPISKYNELDEQLYKSCDFNWDNIKFGLQLMIWGYFKKLIIADRLAVIVNQIYGDFNSYGGATLFIATFFYSLQLYCDFSGGIDIAIGVARMLGIKLVDNFKRPFFATTIDDYWRRWHISLGRWMKDYLFYPLSFSRTFTKLGRITRKLFGNDVGKVLPACIATFIVFIIVGLWQGANWKFIIYGMWNGGLISLSMLLSKRFRKIKTRLRILDSGWHLFCILRTIFLINLGRYFSRADSVTDALRMIKRLFFNPMPTEPFNGVFLVSGLEAADYFILLFALFIMFIAGIIQEKGFVIREQLEKQKPFVQIAIMFVALMVITYFGIYAQGYIPSDFIYMNV